MRLRPRPIAVLLLVPAGVLAGHALGYAGAGHVHGGTAVTAGHSHGYLAAAAAVATLLAGLALAASATHPVAASPVSFGRLLALQWAALLAQEVVEYTVAGQPIVTLLTAPALWLSLAGQLAAAAGATLLVRSARAVGARLTALLGQGRPVVLPGRGLAPWGVATVAESHAVWTLAARGPPSVSD